MNVKSAMYVKNGMNVKSAMSATNENHVARSSCTRRRFVSK
jgi:hypothetical protein